MENNNDSILSLLEGAIEYPIERWDVVMYKSSITKVPMIYFKPDLHFLEFAKKNNYAVVCVVDGTGLIYDCKQIPGMVDKSCFVPNCRPNFCKQTGLYVVSLWSDWYGYPNPGQLGTVKFLGLEEVRELDSGNIWKDRQLANSVMRKANTTPESSDNKPGMSSYDIILIVIAMVIVLLILTLALAK